MHHLRPEGHIEIVVIDVFASLTILVSYDPVRKTNNGGNDSPVERQECEAPSEYASTYKRPVAKIASKDSLLALLSLRLEMTIIGMTKRAMSMARLKHPMIGANRLALLHFGTFHTVQALPSFGVQ